MYFWEKKDGILLHPLQISLKYNKWICHLLLVKNYFFNESATIFPTAVNSIYYTAKIWTVVLSGPLFIKMQL